MARMIEQLTEAKIRTLLKPGLCSDGRGLYLQVRNGGARSWIFRFTSPELFRSPGIGKPRDYGLGSLLDLNLTQARVRAAEAQALVARGVDPIEEKRRRRAAGVGKVAATGPLFRDYAEECITGWQHDWKNKKHSAQWLTSLERYAYPVIGEMPIAAIETKDVLAVIAPYWRTKSETMSRVRGRIERVLAAASVEGLRQGNPAVWKGHLSEAKGLGKKRRAVPFRAMPYAEIPAFICELHSADGIAALALEFVILCAARTDEVLGARLSEISERDRLWNVPGERMKANRPHDVPLPHRTLEILSEVKLLREVGSPFVFPGRSGKPLSNMTMLALLRRMGEKVTVHGFRSAFKTWAEEQTNHPHAVIEAALAHIIGDKTERSYMRGDWISKRRVLMDDWATYCTSTPSESVIAFDTRKAVWA